MARLNKLGDEISARLAGIFSFDRSPQPKKGRGGDGSPNRTPVFSAKQCEWLQRANTESMQAFGAVVAEELQKFDSKIETAASAADAAAAAVAKAAQDANMATSQKVQELTALVAAQNVHLEDAQKKIEALQQASAGPPGLFGRPRGMEQAEADAVKLRLRTGRMGRLGWDTAADILKERCRQVLIDSGVPIADFIKIRPIAHRVKGGSACEIIFKGEAELDAAKKLVLQLSHVVPGGTEEVWLDRKKSREELAPGRMLAADLRYLQSVEASKPEADRAVVERSNFGRCLQVGGRMAFLIRDDGIMRATEIAKERYNESIVSEALQWAEAVR